MTFNIMKKLRGSNKAIEPIDLVWSANERHAVMKKLLLKQIMVVA
jgi:hypothetical protein